MKICDYPGCQDTGYVFKKGKANKCPRCNTGVNKPTLTQEKVEELQENLNIPKEYRDIEFDPEIIKNSKSISQDIKEDPKFNFYLDNIKEIYNEITIGNSLKNSVFIIAPQGFGKTHFVYGCINSLINYGGTVAPYLDSKEIYEKLKKKEDLRELLKSDLCFIKMAAGLINKNDTQVVKLVVNKRARRSLSTIITSRFPVNYLNEIDMDLERYLVRGNISSYSNLKLIESPMGDIKGYIRKYMQNKKW